MADAFTRSADDDTAKKAEPKDAGKDLYLRGEGVYEPTFQHPDGRQINLAITVDKAETQNEALSVMVDALKPLNEFERFRVLRAVYSFYGVDETAFRYRGGAF